MAGDAAPAAGLLLCNLGSPDAPEPAALRRYLREFLSDRRIVEMPRLLWWLILNLAVLPLRPRRSARLYRSIWTDEGSPLLVISARQAQALELELARRLARPVPVVLAMRYGRPSIPEGLQRLRRFGCSRVLVLPLFPQYSATTVASVFDRVSGQLARQRVVPELRTIHGYCDHRPWVEALAASVREHWREHGEGERLLMSFHGIPRSYADAGDPYPEQCRVTATLLAEALGLPESRWELAFQSRFGRAEWVGPASDGTLTAWGREGLSRVDVICPGFAADCLETLEEIAMAHRRLFTAAGGGEMRYIPALNDRPDHVRALSELTVQHLAGWVEPGLSGTAPVLNVAGKGES